MGQTSKLKCPDCSIMIERKNITKHYRKMHPDLDPKRRLKETKVERPRRVFKELPKSAIVGMVIALFVAIILIVVALFALSLFQEDDPTPNAPREVFYTSSDGAVINGTFYSSAEIGASTIYLVHDVGDDRTVWNDYARELQGEGYNVLAIDLRGHGESLINIRSPEITYDWTTMDSTDMLGVELDLQGAYRWVHGEDTEGNKNTDAGEMGSMIGVGRGGLLAFSQVARMSRDMFMSAVILSPLLDVYSLDVFQLCENYGSVRPFMFAASEDDSVARLTYERVLDPRLEDGETNGVGVLVPGGNRGILLLEVDELKQRILDILEIGWVTNTI